MVDDSCMILVLVKIEISLRHLGVTSMQAPLHWIV